MVSEQLARYLHLWFCFTRRCQFGRKQNRALVLEETMNDEASAAELLSARTARRLFSRHLRPGTSHYNWEKLGVAQNAYKSKVARWEAVVARRCKRTVWGH